MEEVAGAISGRAMSHSGCGKWRGFLLLLGKCLKNLRDDSVL